MNKSRNSATSATIRELCRIALFAAVICVCSRISVPMPLGVPLTLQTFAIPLAGIVLGAKNGVKAVLVYILLGLIGLPVFANGGGAGMLFGKTGGFIISFPIVALFAGIGAKKSESKSNAALFFWLTLGAAINYFCGMVVFAVVTSCDLPTAFGAAVLPFIPTAVIKIIMTAVCGKQLEQLTVDS